MYYLLGLVSLLLFLIFLFREQVFRNKNGDFFLDQTFQNRDFFLRPISPKPKPRRFSETKFSETETETFFRGQIFRKQNQDIFFRDQILRNPHKNGKSLETEKFLNQNVNLWGGEG